MAIDLQPTVLLGAIILGLLWMWVNKFTSLQKRMTVLEFMVSRYKELQKRINVLEETERERESTQLHQDLKGA